MEMMIVIAIIALISASIAVAAYRMWGGAQHDQTETNTRTIRHSVTGWLVQNPAGGCPTVAQLITDGILDEDMSRADPWGGPWRISCDDGRIAVSSDGPDKHPGTADDIRVPKNSDTNP
jgi:hypothetical protein